MQWCGVLVKRAPTTRRTVLSWSVGLLNHGHTVALTSSTSSAIRMRSLVLEPLKQRCFILILAGCFQYTTAKTTRTTSSCKWKECEAVRLPEHRTASRYRTTSLCTLPSSRRPLTLRTQYLTECTLCPTTPMCYMKVPRPWMCLVKAEHYCMTSCSSHVPQYKFRHQQATMLKVLYHVSSVPRDKSIGNYNGRTMRADAH